MNCFYKRVVFLVLCLGVIVNIAQSSVVVYAYSQNELSGTEKFLKYRRNVDNDTEFELIDYMSRAEKKFYEYYDALWYQSSMDYKIKNSVDYAVDQVDEDTEVWNKIYFLWNDETQKEVSTSILEKFTIDYRYSYKVFMDNLIETYSNYIAQSVADFAKDIKNIRERESAFLAGHRTISSKTIDVALVKINSDISPTELGSSVSVGDPTASFTTIGLQIFFRKVLTSKLKRKVLSKIGSGLGSKLVTLAEGPAGWIITIATVTYDVYDISKSIMDVPEELKRTYYENLRKGYLKNTPEVIWSVLEDEIKSEFSKIIFVTTNSFDQVVSELATCSSYDEITLNLSESEKNEFVNKLMLFQYEIDGSLCNISEVIGKNLLHLGKNDFSCMLKASRDMPLEIISKWFSLMDSSFCYSLDIPSQFWAELTPSEKNKKIIEWIISLSNKQRDIAIQLNIGIIDWIIDNLNNEEQNILFQNRNASLIESEVAQLQNDVSVKTTKEEKNEITKKDRNEIIEEDRNEITKKEIQIFDATDSDNPFQLVKKLYASNIVTFYDSNIITVVINIALLIFCLIFLGYFVKWMKWLWRDFRK